ncbi:trypsin-like peptidase domain-containing protein [Candidatus Parcubacteria bacterium]|nr:trypsin-like peptidase domain-containing protein [Candidatus Parcubacteria bacterium]
MKKQFTFFLILICVLGLATINFNNQFTQANQTTTVSSVSPNVIAPGDTVMINGINLMYSDIDSSKVCFNDTNTSCVNAVDADSWNDSQIIVKPTLITDYYGITKIVRDGSVINGPFYYLEPIISSVEIVDNKITVYASRSYAYHSFSDSAGNLMFNGQNLDVTYWSRSRIEAIASETLENIGDIEIVVKNGYDAESKPYSTYTCESDLWFCNDWTTCNINGSQTRVCTKTYDCLLINTPSPTTSQSCTPECTEDTWNCSSWGACLSNEQQSRTCNKIYDCSLIDTPSPATSQSCVYTSVCTSNDWSCSNWSACSTNKQQTRTCNKTSNCEGGVSSPVTTQSCTYTPPCTEDIWQCGNWGTCSPQGIQTRSCNRTYNCPSAETASPATSQYCQVPNQPQPQTPSDDLEIVNQSSIIKATVKLLCPVSRTMASQGSGTIIDSDGTILTNKHVVDGTVGCLVGFIDNYNDEPYFADRHIADIYSVSSNSDIAILKLRNPYSKDLTAINITGGNSDNLHLGDQITTYGYPGKFGTKITYTSGDFSGVDGNYLKTTAIIEYGNSGGGAYLKNGTFIGIPSAVIKGDLNSIGYILSVNKINSWLNNSPMAYNNNGNNNYARVSILEDIDLNTLDSLDLFIFDEDENNNADNSDNNDYDKNCKSYYGANSYFTGDFNEDGQSLCSCRSGYDWNEAGNSCVGDIVQEEKSLITKIDNNLSKRISGNILLQVEKNGEGWYVYPDNKKKYYLGRPADAFDIMRNLGLGIKHSELNGYLDSKFPVGLSGKILLDVEQNGEAYYVNPNDLKGYYLNRPADAFNIMRELGLGITNNDIRKIDVGEID